jgi:hypothetical protein
VSGSMDPHEPRPLLGVRETRSDLSKAAFTTQKPTLARAGADCCCGGDGDGDDDAHSVSAFWNAQLTRPRVGAGCWLAGCISVEVVVVVVRRQS